MNTGGELPRVCFNRGCSNQLGEGMWSYLIIGAEHERKPVIMFGCAPCVETVTRALLEPDGMDHDLHREPRAKISKATSNAQDVDD